VSWELVQDRVLGLVELGGPVVAILLGLSVLALAVILFKLWQFLTCGVGRHRRIRIALQKLDAGDAEAAEKLLIKSRSHLAPVLSRALGSVERAEQSRVEAEAAARLDRLESGFRVLDSIAQIAPLLGLFGTVLGMIAAFQALQEAGASVDPSILAGGIWVALMTTAAGLAVAMPTSLLLTFLESRVAKDRALAELAIEILFHPLPADQQIPLRAETAPRAHAA